MASYLRKGVVMGPAGTVYPGQYQPQDLRFKSGRYVVNGSAQPDNCYFYAISGTRWARFWVHLPSLWPRRDYVDPGLLDNLDFQIAAARIFCGVQGVILSFHHDLPQWINGSADPRALPQDVSLTGGWALAVSQFAARYNRFNASRPYGGYSWIDVLEPFNEPNLLAPKSTAPNGWNHGEAVAFMMYRAKQIIGNPGYGNNPIIGGPAVHDTTETSSTGKTDYDEFTRQVLGGLANNGFYNLRDPQGLPYDHSVVWTMHNYNDVERDLAGSDMRSKRVADLLSQRGWAGWPNGTPGYPGIFITEGGADMDRLAALYPGHNYSFLLNKQATLLQNNLDRLGTDDVGRGIGMFCQYLWYTGAVGSSGNTGLLEGIAYNPSNGQYVGGAVRPATNVFTPYPGRY
jgi:hypothetical protein